MKSVCLNGTFVEPAELADPLSSNAFIRSEARLRFFPYTSKS